MTTAGLDDMIAEQSGDVYFYSPEQLDPGSRASPNERNLYVYREGGAAFRRDASTPAPQSTGSRSRPTAAMPRSSPAAG